MLHTPRVAIVGTGFVGSTTAYALLMSGLTAEFVLIDGDQRRAEGHVHDLRDAEVFLLNTRVLAGVGDCRTADVTIITTGMSQTGLKSRLDGLKETTDIVHGLLRDVANYNPRGILLIAWNPVDVLTYASWKWSGPPPNRVIGSGTVLDTARFRRCLAERYRIASNNIHAHMIGEHRDSQIPVLSSPCVAGVPLEGFCQQLGLPNEENALDKIASETRKAGLEIIGANGATYYGIGAALVRIVQFCAVRTRS
jgi:L-lactate dehydrogenase